MRLPMRDVVKGMQSVSKRNKLQSQGPAAARPTPRLLAVPPLLPAGSRAGSTGSMRLLTRRARTPAALVPVPLMRAVLAADL